MTHENHHGKRSDDRILSQSEIVVAPCPEVGEVRLPPKSATSVRMTGLIDRYAVDLTEEENVKFMALFRRSESKVISRFIASTIFGREMKVVKIDKASMDYYIQLTNFMDNSKQSE